MGVSGAGTRTESDGREPRVKCFSSLGSMSKHRNEGGLRSMMTSGMARTFRKTDVERVREPSDVRRNTRDRCKTPVGCDADVQS